MKNTIGVCGVRRKQDGAISRLLLYTHRSVVDLAWTNTSLTICAERWLGTGSFVAFDNHRWVKTPSASIVQLPVKFPELARCIIRVENTVGICGVRRKRTETMLALDVDPEVSCRSIVLPSRNIGLTGRTKPWLAAGPI